MCSLFRNLLSSAARQAATALSYWTTNSFSIVLEWRYPLKYAFILSLLPVVVMPAQNMSFKKHFTQWLRFSYIVRSQHRGPTLNCSHIWFHLPSNSWGYRISPILGIHDRNSSTVHGNLGEAPSHVSEHATYNTDSGSPGTQCQRPYKLRHPSQ